MFIILTKNVKPNKMNVIVGMNFLCAFNLILCLSIKKTIKDAISIIYVIGNNINHIFISFVHK